MDKGCGARATSGTCCNGARFALESKRAGGPGGTFGHGGRCPLRNASGTRSRTICHREHPTPLGADRSGACRLGGDCSRKTCRLGLVPGHHHGHRSHGRASPHRSLNATRHKANTKAVEARRGKREVVSGQWAAVGVSRKRGTTLFAFSDLSALGGTRIPNLLIRSQMLYPIELRAQNGLGSVGESIAVSEVKCPVELSTGHFHERWSCCERAGVTRPTCRPKGPNRRTGCRGTRRSCC